MTITLVPLGTAAGGVPGPDGAGSGHLVVSPRARLLLDCGNGVLGRLRARMDFADLDGLVLTHLHFDHCLDLMPLLLARTLSAPLKVHAPAGSRAKLSAMFALFSSKPALYEGRLALVEHAGPGKARVGDLTVSFVPVEHNVPCLGVRVSGAAGEVLAYSGDSRTCEALAALARDADLFLCEATYQDGPVDPGGLDAHMTAEQAGDVARRASARRLLLTHIKATLEEARSVKEAARRFAGPVDAARGGTAYDVGP